MKTSLECMECNVKQLIKISKLLNITKKQQETASKKLFQMLSQIDYNHTNPYIMGETWKIITTVYNNKDPYKEIKKEFNELLLSLYDEIKEMVISSDNELETALKVAVVGNIIDFGARHTFSKTDVLNRVKKYSDIAFSVDSSKKLLEEIKTAKSLFYIGDNCGEIVLDKLFIETIKKYNKDIKVSFGVRGNPILNDVTEVDAKEVSMSDIANVVSSGVAVPGTIVENSTSEFQKLFYESDVVIAKGQGNFESLSDKKRHNLFLVLLAKCDYVAKTIGCEMMDYIILENFQ